MGFGSLKNLFSLSQCLYLFQLSNKMIGTFEQIESSITVEEKLTVTKAFFKHEDIFFL